MKAFLVTFRDDRDAEAFAAGAGARQAPDGSTRILVGYGDDWTELGRDAVADVTPVDPGTVTRPEVTPRPGSAEEKIRQAGDRLRAAITWYLGESGPATERELAEAAGEPWQVILVTCRDMAGRGDLAFDDSTGEYSLPATTEGSRP